MEKKLPFMYPEARYGRPGEPREKRKKATPEQVAAQNARNLEKRIWRYLKQNFRKGDYWLTLTYRKDERPADMDTVKGHVRRFLSRLRYAYKRMEKECRYMYSIELGSRGGVHIHMCLNALEGILKKMQDLWGYGHVNITLIYDEGNLKKLAAYLSKANVYNRSRNLVFPRIRKKKLSGSRLPRDPKAYKGFYVEKESVEEGINPFSLLPWLHYIQNRLKT